MPRSVCMVVHDHYPKDVRVWRAARAASEAGWRVTVVCLRHPDEAASEELEGVSVRRLGVEHRPGSKLGRMLGEYAAFTLLAVWTVLRLHRRAKTVIHINNPPDFLMLAAVVPKLLGSRVIFDVHDLTPLMFDARFHGRPAARAVIKALTVQQRLACNFADRVITPHRPSARRISESGVPLAHIGIMMNPPDGEVLDRVLAAPQSPRDSKDGFVIAYHGTVTHWYGIDLIVDAMDEVREDLPQARAIILGDGDAIDQVRGHVRAAGLEDRVELSGRFLPNAEALTTVRSADCGVVPNLPSALNDLTLSGKLLDYTLLGVPAVVAELEVQAAHFDETEVTFFKPGDAHSLAQAIRWVAANPQEAAVKAQRARTRAEAYSWPHQRDAYQRLLAELAGGEVAPIESAVQ